MQMKMAMQDAGELRSLQIRIRLYGASAALATLVFLAFTYVMSMVPGIYPGQKLWMLAIEIGLLIVSLGLGIWGFRTSEAPFTAGRLGTIVGVVLILELALCIISVFQVAAATHR
jgi:hypothetical protein